MVFADIYCFVCKRAFSTPRSLKQHLTSIEVAHSLENLRLKEAHLERYPPAREDGESLASAAVIQPSLSSNGPAQETRVEEDDDTDFPAPDLPPTDSTQEEEGEDLIDDLRQERADDDDTDFPAPDLPPTDSTQEEEGEDLIDDLRQKLCDHKDSFHEKFKLTESLCRKVELLSILDKADSPQYLYEDVMNWSCGQGAPGLRDISSVSRPSVFIDLNKRYNLQGLAPKKIATSLPKSGCKVDIITHDFLECLYSILTDRHLMREENLLLFSDEDGGPFGRRPDSSFMEDINDGTVYSKAVDVHVKVRGRDLLCPIILFIDKTHCDTKGRLTLEPVSMTIGLLTKEVRRLPESWRCLGYVNNFADLPSYKNPVDKLCDYHFVLENILQSFKDAQKRGGISWQLTYKTKTHSCVLKTPLLLVLGDTEGHDKICGKYQIRTNAARCLCRVCDCPTDKTGDPFHKHTLTLGPKIEKLCQTALETRFAERASKATETLKNLSYHVIRNAFTGIVWCDEKRGVNGATTPEILHVVQHGLILYLIAALTGLKQYKKVNSQTQLKETCSKKRTSKELDDRCAKKRKAKGPVQLCASDECTDGSASSSDDDSRSAAVENESSGNPDLDQDSCNLDVALDISRSDDDSSDDDSSKEEYIPTKNLYEEMAYVITSLGSSESANGVFTAKMTRTVNAWAIVYGQSLKHQSDDDYKYALFNGGILSLAKKNGHEERCVVMVLLLIFCSKQGKEVLEPLMGEERMALFILVHSFMLLLEDFYRCPKFEKKFIYTLKQFIPLFLLFYAMALQRKDGMGMNFIKFHLLLHYADDLWRIGPSLSTDSSPGETLHKSYKTFGLRTQRQKMTFEYEVGCRHHERIVLNRAKQDLPEGEPPQPNRSVLGCHFRVDRDGMFDVTGTSRATWYDLRLMEEVTSYVQRNLLPFCSTENVFLYGRCRHRDILYHGMNKVTKAAQDQWRDWVYVHWPEWGSLPIPSRIVTFIEIVLKEGETVTDPLVTGTSYGNSGVYALVHAVPQSLYERPEAGNGSIMEDGSTFLAHQSTRIVHKSGLATNTEERPDLFLVHVDSMFRRPAVAVPYDIEDPNGSEWLFVEPRERWHKIFLEWMKELLDQHKDTLNSA
jgi:hypothetical protein